MKSKRCELIALLEVRACMLLAGVSSDVTDLDWYACMALKLSCGALAGGTHGGECSNGIGAAGGVDLAARPSFPGEIVCSANEKCFAHHMRGRLVVVMTCITEDHGSADMQTVVCS